MQNEVLYTPAGDALTQSAMWRFIQSTAGYHGGMAGDYPALHAWSVREPEHFYAHLWDALDIIGDRGDVIYVPGNTQLDTRFFPYSYINYSENLLRYSGGSPAVIACREGGYRRELSRDGLRQEVSRAAQAMRGAGVGRGDRVAAIIINDLEAIIGYLACASIGAVWSSCSPDFGADGAAERLCQVDPSLLIAVSGYRYGGKTYDVTPSIIEIARRSPVNSVVLIGDKVPSPLSGLPVTLWDDWLQPYRPGPLQFERLPVSAPLAILFSSGTTGKPKCIVHSATGLLLQHKKEHVLHCDLKADERFFYYTTCGWMMWNWQVSALAAGATLVTYDGNPLYPSHSVLPDLIDAESIAVFGTSAKYLDLCARAGLRPTATHRLQDLRLVLSTGSPLLPGGFDYIYTHWKTKVDLASISGGTDICGCFLGGNPVLPVRRGELKCAMLGMDIDIVNDQGEPVVDTPGELVCRNAHVSMPLHFLGDPDGSRYHQAYFSRFKGLWTHGDFAERRTGGGWVIHGRSDNTLNPGGVRIGTAEIYRQLDAISEIEEAIAVGHEVDGDQRVVLFVRLRPGVRLEENLVNKVRDRIRRGASPHHVPRHIIPVAMIPRTRSGKISESAVRDAIHGREVRNTAALENPEALDAYRDLPELRE